ncbi:ABC transporter substrate-binding protein [Amycolatopsis sp. PS_44_ISF1]|uniref:ABC transporter substrate-binding protein n=1 Tax=Amycolatopsis sp. PS_44_ISF1 TaxID=2974917 RepID=UPI0028DF6188|nr:ABC transporter substrate-binding protein [Amycolatopsis sp. PS_44_ISF1]MDT8914662.1 ABC transporter substrate-binding protein [Amycolatopsis sp. PS_44_ISF1]
MRSKVRRSVLGFVMLLIATSACSGTNPTQPFPSPDSGDASGYPVTLQNCGRTITVRSEPRRVVSLWQSVTEMLLALGLRNRIVGVQNNYAPYPPSVAEAAKGLNAIGSSMSFPAKEVLLSERPDFVAGQELAGFAFDTSQGYASVQQIEQTGATVYGANICNAQDAQDVKVWNVDTAAKTLTDFGRIFNVRSQAAKVVARLDADKQKVVAAVRGEPTVKTAYFNGGTGPVIVLAGGVYDSLISTAGGTNVFPPNAVYISKETFAACDADVILVGTFPGQSFAQEKAYLEQTFPNVPAVKNGRISEMPTEQTDSSISVMAGLTEIADALHPGLDLPVPAS